MYICVCNAVSDSAIRDAVSDSRLREMPAVRLFQILPTIIVRGFVHELQQDEMFRKLRPSAESLRQSFVAMSDRQQQDEGSGREAQ